jgi:hypothetical protein
MFAEIAPDAASNVLTQLPWWAVLLLSAAGSIGGSLLTLFVGWLSLSRTETYRRASRWEPLAEQLWRERLKSYREYLTAYDGSVTNYGVVSKIADPHERAAKTNTVASEFQHATLLLATIASVAVHKSASELEGVWRGRIRIPLTSLKEVQAEITTRLNLLVNAMRDDLGVEGMDERTKDWFPAPAIESIPAAN